MKKILLPLALVSALLVSCEKPVQEEYYYISIYPRELHFTLYGEEQSVTMDSSHDWELAYYPDWCIPSIKSGQSGAEVIFTVTENDSESQRDGKIIFSCGDAADSIIVLQDGLNDNIKFNQPSVKQALCNEYRIKFNGQRVIIDIDKDNDEEISYKEAAEAKYMNVHIKYVNPGNNFPELKYFTALEYLSVECNLDSLDLSKNTALTDLDCGSNQLTSLDVSNNTALTYLDCSSNQLTSLDVSKNTALTYLDCSSNQLTSLDVSKNTALTDLYCVGNMLTSLDVSNNTALTGLQCAYNNLTSLDLSNNPALTDLYCSDNPLQKLILYKYHIISDSYMEDIELEYGDIIEYME